MRAPAWIARRLPPGDGVWDRVATQVTTRPGATLLLSLLVVSLPLLALPGLRTTHDVLSSLPQDAESVAAQRRHLPAGETSPLILVIDGDESVYQPVAFRALGDLSKNLRRLPGVASVRSVAMPTDGERPEIDPALEGQAGDLAGQVDQAAAGAAQIAAGVQELETGLRTIDARLPELRDGLAEGRDGAARLHDGVVQARSGVRQVRAGLARLRDGLGEAQDGAARLRDEVARPTERELAEAIDGLATMTVGRTDPMYQEVYESVGEAYARVTGRYPVGHERAGQRVDPAYGGLTASLDELAAGLGQARSGADRLDGGLAQLETGLGQAVDGLRRLRDGLGDGVEGVAQLQEGIERMLDGVAGRLRPGTQRLAEGLAEGSRALEESGVGELILGGEGPFVLTPGMLDIVPELRERLSFFTAEEGTRTRVFIGLASDPFSDEAIATARLAREVAERSLLDSPLADADVVPTGSAAFVSEIDRAAAQDFPVIVAAVSIGVFLVLVALLRSLVAPLYMVLTVLLSYASVMGLTALVFQRLLGEPGVQWWVPPILFVLLVGLGVDYSIFLMGRVREEAQRRITRDAVAEGVRTTGRVITSAGIILAGTFAALIAAPMRSMTQLGFAAAAGILLDTFLVRALLVPSLAVLLGRWNWWPSARASAD
ncbi:MAG TPA: MMPL family transporter [Egibacteraceae bacterium]|nr:MMPL family transporter [Egibacteraceae bacterium]